MPSCFRQGFENVEMTAIALAAAIRAKSVSCVEVATPFLDQIDRHNGKINA